MKRRFLAVWCVARAMVRDVCAGRLQSKTGEGEISTKPPQSILGLPGEPIFSETSAAGTRSRIFAISHRSDLRSSKHSWTAVQHLRKALFLSKQAEPPLKAMKRPWICLLFVLVAYAAHAQIQRFIETLRRQVALPLISCDGR